MDWAAALLGSGLTGLLVGVVLFLCRNWILERLKQGIKYEYDARLTHLEADIRRRDREIEDLRSAALQALTTRQSEVEGRRLRAIDELVGSLHHLRAGAILTQLLASLNFP